MLAKIVIGLIAYFALIYMVGTIIGDMTQSDEKLLDTLKISD